MAMTLSEKIIARASGNETVKPGDIVTCAVDLAMLHDSGGPRRVQPLLDELAVGLWDADRVVVASDHYVPAVDPQSAAILALTRNWVKQHGIKHFYDMRGICHIVLAESGLLQPGMFVVGGDSHSPTGGAFGCFMFGVGATDMAGVLATGETWVVVPGTMRINWHGHLPHGTCAKDMMLYTCARLGAAGAAGQAVEYSGSLVQSMSLTERQTLCNMAAELGAQTGIVTADETTIGFLNKRNGASKDWPSWHSDNSADYVDDHTFDASSLSPQVAAPGNPSNAAGVEDFTGTSIDQAYIGACTGAKLEDLHFAAKVLRGKQVANKVRLLIAPASAQVTETAAMDGTLATLTSAGALVMPSGCGACAGYGAGVLAAGETCIASTARNYAGRMGHPESRVYLGSPYTTAAAAVAGEIIDPRELIHV